MSRRKQNLSYLMKKNLSSKIRYGNSKEKDTPYIYSEKTFKKYCSVVDSFGKYCKEIGIKNMSNVDLNTAKSYLESREAEGYSAFTLRSEGSAIAKLFSSEDNIVKSSDFEYNYPIRYRSNVQTNRSVSNYNNKHFANNEKNNNLVQFATMCGCRRNELEHLKFEDLKEREDGSLYLDLDGTYCKHGKAREIEIDADTEEEKDFFKNYLESRCSELGRDGVFGAVHHASQIHQYRGDYAKNMYKKLARTKDQMPQNEKYYCRGEKKGFVFDKIALMRISESLGHTRCNVVVNSYLYYIKK